MESAGSGASVFEAGDGAHPPDASGGSTDGASEAARDEAGIADADADVDAPVEHSDTTDEGGDAAADTFVTCGKRACATPLCCDGNCATAHSNGLGQFFYDCSPLNTFNSTQAFAACTAYTGKMSLCQNDPIVCGGGDQVCSSGASMCACWRYSGNNAGHVLNTGATCQCLGSASPTWN